ncbi:RDD family protein [Candidatus Daviesbacteria bacterium]|nr:RDD family protein [Candidatus Daviesbacteria bacterium]
MIYASIWRRLIAWVIDAFILLGLSLFLLFPYFSLSNAYSKWSGFVGLPVWVAFIFFLIVNNVYFIYFIGRKGQGIGGRLLHIKVISLTTNSIPTYKQATIRQIIIFLSECSTKIVFIGTIISYAILVIDGLWMLKEQNKQTLHDKLAGTIVIKTGVPELSSA